MNYKLKTLLASVTSMALLAAVAALPAQAALTPKLTIAASGVSLEPSTIANFSTTSTLRLTLHASSGEITIPDTAPADTGVVVGNGSALHGATVSVVGTQHQLNLALDLATISSTCGSQVTITGSVTPGPYAMAYDEDNGHWYMNIYTSSGIGWSDAKTAADAMTFDGADGHGYLATITSAEENTFINDNYPMVSWLGASDSDVEGEWSWLDGPEQGTLFYSQGAKVAGEYSNFNVGEPNDLNGEDFLQTWSADTWNDYQDGIGNYLVEFGGYPGDDFNGLQSANATASVSTEPLLTGAGTEASPYLVANFTDFTSVPVCFGSGRYFRQTADINLGSGFHGFDFNFVGHYDGNGKTIDGSDVTLLSRGIFSAASGDNGVTSTSITNLTVQGFNISSVCDLGILFTALNGATVDNVHVTATANQVDCRFGALAGSTQGAVIRNSSVNVTMTPMFMFNQVGGMVGSARDTTFTNDQCSTSIEVDPFQPSIAMVYSVGGCVGESTSSVYDKVSSSGSIFDETIHDVRFIMDFMQVGGLIGQSYADTISKSSSSLNIGSVRGNAIGGLVGASYAGTVDSSFATGNIDGQDSQATGGLFGVANDTTISNSYSTGAVTTYSNSGALVGYLAGNASVTNSYSSSHLSIQDLATTHGLIGAADSNQVTASFWNPETVGVPGTLPAAGGELPKSDAQMKDIGTYSAWAISATPSSDSKWAMCSTANGGYPYLAWQDVAGGCQRSFALSTKPLVTGNKYVGSTLTAVAGSWDSLAELSYQWFANGTAIGQATSSTLVLAAGQLGKNVTVKVTGSKSGYASVVVESDAYRVTTVPTTKTYIIGGFSGTSTKIGKATTKAINQAVLKVGTIVTIKCDAFSAGKRLSASAKKIATARAKAVCVAIKKIKNAATTTLTTSVAKSTDKMTAGVRVTITSVKP
ncbi:MAG: hypothetical protein RJA30_107 [Actinomycetota bacterium]|jgi:hypothetical protein